MIPLSAYVAVSAVLFITGLFDETDFAADHGFDDEAKNGHQSHKGKA